jgi:hypothetical protein
MRVYLSRSNRSNADLVSKVRAWLNQACSVLDGEVVEFRGGDYNHKELLTCDVVVMIAAQESLGIDTKIGKGLSDQVDAAGTKGIPVWYVTSMGIASASVLSNILSGNVIVRPVIGQEIIDHNWQNSYADLTLGSNMHLSTVLEAVAGNDEWGGVGRTAKRSVGKKAVKCTDVSSTPKECSENQSFGIIPAVLIHLNLI